MANLPLVAIGDRLAHPGSIILDLFKKLTNNVLKTSFGFKELDVFKMTMVRKMTRITFSYPVW
jgi:hypothetical protein